MTARSLAISNGFGTGRWPRVFHDRLQSRECLTSRALPVRRPAHQPCAFCVWERLAQSSTSSNQLSASTRFALHSLQYQTGRAHRRVSVHDAELEQKQELAPTQAGEALQQAASACLRHKNGKTRWYVRPREPCLQFLRNGGRRWSCGGGDPSVGGRTWSLTRWHFNTPTSLG